MNVGGFATRRVEHLVGLVQIVLIVVLCLVFECLDRGFRRVDTVQWRVYGFSGRMSLQTCMRKWFKGSPPA